MIVSLHCFNINFVGYLTSKRRLENLQPVLDAKVDELRRKLSDVEYISSSISQELASLNTAVQKIMPANKTQTALSLPSIYTFLPHLVTQPHGLNPKIRVAAKKGRKGQLMYNLT